MKLQRLPVPSLRPFVDLLWGSDERAAERVVLVERELALPTASMHVVIRTSPGKIRLFDSLHGRESHTFGYGVVGGIRSGVYVKDHSQSVRSVGAMLRPGASELLFGATASELAERHTSLEDVWGRSAIDLWERLQEEAELARQVDVFEAFLGARLPRVSGIHPAIAHALERFHDVDAIGDIVAETGYSHRRFIELFRRTVGLPPKVYRRVLRLQEALKLADARKGSLADAALTAGYSDQAHFSREFRELTGISPRQYRLAQPSSVHHVPESDTGVNFLQDAAAPSMYTHSTRSPYKKRRLRS